MLAKLGQISDSDVASFKRMQDQAAKGFSQISTEGKKVIPTIDNITDSVEALVEGFVQGVGEEVVKQLGEAGVSLTDLKNKTNEVGDAQDSLKKQLRAMTDQLAMMEAQGKRNTAEYDELKNKAGELRDAIDDANEAIKRSGSDTKGFDNLIDLTSGVAGGFAVAQGAAALFGEQGEEIQQTLLKVNAAMAILQGLQQIQALASKEQFKSLATLVGMQKVQVLQTNLQAAAESKNIIVRYAAVAAQKVLNAAMEANPIGIVIVAITAVVAAFKIFSSNAKEAADAQAKLNSALAEAGKYLDAELQGIENSNKRIIASMKEKGASQDDINKQELANMQAMQSARQKALDKVTQQLNDRNVKENLSNEEYNQLSDAQLKLQQDISNAETDIYVKKKENQTELNNEILNQQKDADQKAKEQRDKNLQITQADEQAIFNIKQRALQTTADFYSKVADNSSLGTDAQLDALKKSLQAQLDIIELQKQNELSNVNLTANQKLDIIDKYNKAAEKLTQDGYDKRKEIIDTAHNDQEKSDAANYQKLLDDQKAALEKLTGNIDFNFKRIAQNNSNEQVQRLGNLEQEFQQGNITLTQFLEKRDKINQEYSDRGLNNQIANIEAKIAAQKQFGADTSALESELNDLKKQQYDKDAKTFEDEEKKKTDIAKKHAQERQEIIQAGLQIAQELSDAYFEAQQQQIKANLDAQLAILDQQKDAELNAKGLTEQQKANIQKKYDDQARQLKTQAARKDRQAQINQAIVNGLLTITKTFAEYGFTPAAWIAAAAAAVSTAITVAKIRSTPLPQFKKGTRNAPAGYVWVGEEGPEIVQLKGGEKIYKYADSMKIGETWRGGSVASADDILNLSNPSVPKDIIVDSGSNRLVNIDYERLGQAVAAKMPKPVINSIVMDEYGFSKHIYHQGSKRTLRNRRYSFK